MKRSPDDYDLTDVDLYVARSQGYTLDQILGLDFPAPDYTDSGGNGYWTPETVMAWLERFHTAIHAMAQAADPEGFDRFLQMLGDLIRDDDEEDRPPLTTAR